MSKKSNEHEEGYYEAKYVLLHNAIIENIKISIPSWTPKDLLERQDPKKLIEENCYLEFSVDAKSILKIFAPEKLDELLEKGLEMLKNRKDDEV